MECHSCSELFPYTAGVLSLCCGQWYCRDCSNCRSIYCRLCGKNLLEVGFQSVNTRFISNAPSRISCPQQCGEQFAPSNLPNHLLSCPNWNVTCGECGLSMNRASFPLHSCPKALRFCEYLQYGCTQKISNENYSRHLTENKKEHARLLSLKTVPLSPEDDMTFLASMNRTASNIFSRKRNSLRSSSAQPLSENIHTNALSMNDDSHLNQQYLLSRNLWDRLEPILVDITNQLTGAIRYAESSSFWTNWIHSIHSSGAYRSSQMDRGNLPPIILFIAIFAILFIFLMRSPIIFFSKLALFCFQCFTTFYYLAHTPLMTNANNSLFGWSIFIFMVLYLMSVML